MALKGRDVAAAGIVCFIAWGYAVSWVPSIRWVGWAFVAGVAACLVGTILLILLTSRGSAYSQRNRSARPNAVAFLAPDAWPRETSALRVRQTYIRQPLCPDSPSLS